MKEVPVFSTKPFLTTAICDGNLPVPQDNGILIRVMVASSKPKDYKHLYATGVSINSGDDIAGYVHGLGKMAALGNEFKIGDRVAASHPMMAPGGTSAEYAVAPTETTLLIPDGIDFESATKIPLTTLAAILALFRRQSLLPPWMKRSPNAPLMPLIIYGASSALRTYAVKLARHSNIHPIVAIGGIYMLC